MTFRYSLIRMVMPGSSSRCLSGHWIVPTTVGTDERVSFLRPPSESLVGPNPMVCLQDWIDPGPGGLHRILTGEERSIAGHGIAQKPFIGRFLSRLLFQQVELSLFADEFLSRELDPS